MLGDVLILTFLSLTLILSLVTALSLLARCRRLTILDVPKVLRPVRQNRVIQLLHSNVEDTVRSVFSSESFQDSQLMSLYEIREYLLRMSHNAFVLIVWANTEIWRETKYKTDMEDRELYIELGRKLHGAAIEFRLYALLTLFRVNFWMIFRSRSWSPFPVPRMTELREIGGVRFYPSYRRLREAVGNLCLAYGQEFYDELMALI
jgi:hypothetical protein